MKYEWPILSKEASVSEIYSIVKSKFEERTRFYRKLFLLICLDLVLILFLLVRTAIRAGVFP